MKMLNSLVFFGSGPVAAASLRNLIAHFAVELVVTKSRPAHHKDPAPVEELAKQYGLPMAFADNKAALEQVILNTKPLSQCGVVIDYGVIISQLTIDYFPLGIVNSHFSILPEWRGADPITFSLLSGQPNTGVSLMRIDSGLDTGDIIAEAPVVIESYDTSQSLTEKLIETSDALLNELLPHYIAGSITPIPQASDRVVTYSRKLTKQDAIIDTSKPASTVEREVRAYSEWPKSKLHINNQLTVIIIKANVAQEQLRPGEIQVTVDKRLLLGMHIGSLEITELMPLGKQKMSAKAFINGYASRI